MNAQQLKNSILQYAMQGKLVLQDPNDKPAAELVQSILEEKQRLTQEKVIKKEKRPLPITDDQVPFDIPESWEWVMLESITYTIGNKNNQIKQSEILEKGKFPVVSQSLNLIEGYSNDEKKVLKINSSPVIVFGDHSKTLKIIDFDFVIGADGTKVLVPVLLNAKFLYFAISLNLINMRDRGYSRHFQFLKAKAIPIPPLEEQERIVEKIESLYYKIEKFGLNQKELHRIQASFPSKLENSLLYYAMQGKLVEQDLNDEPATLLIERIREEMEKLIRKKVIKKENSLLPITKDEIPFDIPESWEWVRLGEIINLVSGQDFSPDKYNHCGEGIPYITGASTLSKEGVILNRWTETPRSIAENGDLLIVCKGSGYGKTLICNIERAHIARQIMAIKKSDHLNLEFIELYIQSSLSLIKKLGQGVIPGIDRKSILNLLLPLPPLKEQERIVEKTRENYSLLSKLLIK